jgi:hypothetical protein
MLVTFHKTDTTCPIVARSASGTVTLTQVDSEGYAGSFDVTLDSGDSSAGVFHDHVTGTFDTRHCGAINLASGWNPPCGCGPCP